VISPLLANIYLHWFEVRFQRPDGPGEWANAKVVRYADDFVILARHLGRRIVRWVEDTLEGPFRLTINREKTRVVKMYQPGASLDFLGFTLRYERDLFGRGHRYLRMEPSRKAERRLREKVRAQAGPQWNWLPLPGLIRRLNLLLRGWCAYFRLGHPHRVFHRLDGYILDRLRRHLRRRSQRGYRTPANETLDAHLRSYGLHFLLDLERSAHASCR
jgi:RNA-directed DNA polymerase